MSKNISETFLNVAHSVTSVLVRGWFQSFHYLTFSCFIIMHTCLYNIARTLPDILTNMLFRYWLPCWCKLYLFFIFLINRLTKIDWIIMFILRSSLLCWVLHFLYIFCIFSHTCYWFFSILSLFHIRYLSLTNFLHECSVLLILIICRYVSS